MQKLPTPSASAMLARRTRQRLAAILCWAGAGAAVIFLAWVVISRKLTIINFMVIVFAIISLSAFGILALSGDLAWSDQDLDEGQIDASRNAQSNAFTIGYLGIIGLWMGYIFVPAWAAQATVHLGMLALLISGIWFGTWVWQRWHG
ncbi:MAG: hypothetical protein H0X24_05660 [Ktedonobacterales bacterium]|nr:hypothetical protein [Ktedonobacterales bacterium]